jgi:hypothetical protein
VDADLIEAAQAMGCHRWHIMRHVLLPKLSPGVIGGLAITVVSVIGASAMARVLGSGGLGDMAIRYGYQRFHTEVMAIVIVIPIALSPPSRFSRHGVAHLAIAETPDKYIAYKLDQADGTQVGGILRSNSAAPDPRRTRSLPGTRLDGVAGRITYLT